MMRTLGWVLIVLSAIAAVGFTGCGTKGPALAPIVKGQKIASPVNVKYKVFDNQISLSWNHEVDKETAAIMPQGFEVFMAKKNFEDCEGCPFVFKLTGYVPMPSMEFTAPLEKGFKYYFRLRCVKDKMKSEYSKTVQFENK